MNIKKKDIQMVIALFLAFVIFWFPASFLFENILGIGRKLFILEYILIYILATLVIVAIEYKWYIILQDKYPRIYKILEFISKIFS